MKNLIYLFLGALLVISCNTDPCKDVVCGDNGACDEGACLCAAGYEKDAAGKCNTEIRAKFIGSWTVTDSCTLSSPASYAITTINNNSIMAFNVTNVWNAFNASVTATVTDSTSFTISRQEPDNDGFFVESIGAGTINNGKVSIMYVVSNESDTTNITRDTCNSVWQ